MQKLYGTGIKSQRKKKNKEERILKSYNLLTGLSDHNMTLMVRKLSNKRFVKLKKPNYNSLIIPKNDVPKLDNELKEINWTNMVWDEVDSSCRQVMNKIDGIVSKYLKKRKSGKQRSLPWINESIKKLMKQRDQILKQAIKSKLNTDMVLYKSLRNCVIKDMRLAKSNFYITAITEARGNPSVMWKTINNIVKPKGK